MTGHNICFHGEIKKKYLGYYPQNPLLSEALECLKAKQFLEPEITLFLAAFFCRIMSLIILNKLWFIAAHIRS